MKLLCTLLVVAAPMMASSRGQVAPDPASEIDRLVAQLEPYGDRSVAWSATARLQKLGAPAATALAEALRRDAYRSDHGNHSPIMEALAKIGPPAARALDAVLTAATLQSASLDDRNLVARATQVLARIGVDETAPTLVRIARESTDAERRTAAAGALIGRWPPASTIVPVDESCLGRHWSTCPFDPDAPRVAAAVTPFLDELRDMLIADSAARTSLAIAPVLVRWGDGAVRRAGEDALIALVPSGDSWVAQQAIDLLGALGVGAAGTAIRERAEPPASDTLRRSAAAALERLQDPAYGPLVVSLLTSDDPYARQWSMQSVRRSQNVAFVPALIERLGDGALPALLALTFQDLGTDREAWRAWWSANQDVPWSAHLARFLDTIMAQIIRAEPWTMNAWMAQLEDAHDPAVLPFFRAYLLHPRTDPGRIGPTSSRGGGGPSPVFGALTRLVGDGSLEARQVLYECLGAETAWFVRDCPLRVAAFDSQWAIERLSALIAAPDSLRSLRRHSPEGIEAVRLGAAETLVALGDARAIPVLIELIGSERGQWAWSANRLLRYYTQEDVALESDAPADVRRQAYEAWHRWWQENGDTFVVNVRAARVDLECCRV